MTAPELAPYGTWRSPITPEALAASSIRLGGIELDFTRDNQGSDLVAVTQLAGDEYRTMTTADWRSMLQR